MKTGARHAAHGGAGLLGAHAPPPSKAMEQFGHINRHWDAREGRYVAKLLPGDYYVTTHDEMVFTVLGSCVSACIRDRALGIGGMNHFMLPENASDGSSAWGKTASAATRYGNVAMERLVNDILKAGGKKQNLEVKLVGGGRVLDAMTDIGARNIQFVREFVAAEGYKIIGEDLGSVHPRKVMYHPMSGDARVKKLGNREAGADLVAREKSYLRRIDTTPVAGEIELF
jgi:chemotaxis protein CheD